MTKALDAAGASAPEAGDLAPCPFCGGNASHSVGSHGDGTPWPYVECENCAAFAEPKIWNMRKAERDATEALAVRVSGLEQLLLDTDNLLTDERNAREKAEAQSAETEKRLAEAQDLLKWVRDWCGPEEADYPSVVKIIDAFLRSATTSGKGE
jgi:hypothetical protein